MGIAIQDIQLVPTKAFQRLAPGVLRKIDRAGATDEVLTQENLAALYGVPIAVGRIDGRRAIVSNPKGAAP